MTHLLDNHMNNETDINILSGFSLCLCVSVVDCLS